MGIHVVAGTMSTLDGDHAKRRPSLTRGFWARGAALGLSALAAGCATYTPKPIAPMESASSLENRRLDDAQLLKFIGGLSPDGAVAEAQWDLTTLTLAALYFHPDVEISRAKLALARAGVVTAGQIPNPNLNLSPTYHATLANPSAWTVGILVNFLLETFGKRELRVEQARNLVEAAREDLASASWQIRGKVRSALLDVWAATGRIRLIERRRGVQQQLVAVLERRFAGGEIAALDVARERINLNQIELSARDADREAAEARTKLATAVGVPASALGRVDPSLAAIERPAQTPDVDGLTAGPMRRKALFERPDVLGLLAEYEASQAALRLEVARQYPDLTLGPGYTYDQGDNLFSFGLGADLPVFNQNQGPIAEAEARRRETAARFLGLQAKIIGDIDAAVASYRASMRTVSTADALLEGQTQRRQQLDRAFRQGEVDRSAPLTADLELAVIELARFEALVQHRRALELIEDALQQSLFDGGGLYMRLPERMPSKMAEGS